MGYLHAESMSVRSPLESLPSAPAVIGLHQASRSFSGAAARTAAFYARPRLAQSVKAILLSLGGIFFVVINKSAQLKSHMFSLTKCHDMKILPGCELVVETHQTGTLKLPHLIC